MSLAKDISTLEEIRARLERVRNVPRQLLQPGGKGDFATIKELSEAVGTAEVQQALDRAMTSLKADRSGLTSRRAKRKRERSVEGYVEEDHTRTSLLPSCPEKGLTLESLPEWARARNARTANKLRMRDNRIRYAIPEVMAVYMSVGGADEISVETIRAFGPRETTDGQGQSKYTVFRQLSQQLTHILEQEAPVKFQTVVALLDAYEDVFVSACGACGRVVAGSGHIPALIRTYDGGSWRVRHIGCGN